MIQVGPGLFGRLFLRPPILTGGNFEALKPINPLFTIIKDIKLLKKHIKNQEASYNFRLGFFLSNRPHFNVAL